MLSKCTCNDNNCSKKNYALDRCYRHLLNDHMKFPEGTNNALKAHLLLDRSSQKQKIKESDQMIMNIQNVLKIIQKFHTKFNEKTLNFNKDDIDSIKLFHDSFGTRNNNINDLINKKVKSNHVCIRVLNNMFKKLMNIYKYQDIEEKIEDSESEDSYVYTYSDQLLIDVASKVSLCHILDLFNEIEPDIDRNQTKFTDKEIHYLKKYFQNILKYDKDIQSSSYLLCYQIKYNESLIESKKKEQPVNLVRLFMPNFSVVIEEILEYISDFHSDRMLYITHSMSMAEEPAVSRVLKPSIYGIMFTKNNHIREFVIEFDAQFHFFSLGNFIPLFQEVMKRDCVQDFYMWKNNISILRIHYKNEEDIEELVDQYINDLWEDEKYIWRTSNPDKYKESYAHIKTCNVEQDDFDISKMAKQLGLKDPTK